MKVKDSYTEQPIKWYNAYKFPLIPVISTRKANEHNTSSFSFHWLFFQVWTRDAFDFELAIVISEHWGIGINGLLPYIRWVVCIPCPEKLGMWFQKNLWRKPAASKR